jgi:hypothetical protein
MYLKPGINSTETQGITDLKQGNSTEPKGISVLKTGNSTEPEAITDEKPGNSTEPEAITDGARKQHCASKRIVAKLAKV